MIWSVLSNAGTTATTRTGKLLVVDDDEGNRETLCRRLQQQGHEVLRAVDGFAALQMIQDQRFDLILLDIDMPVLNGISVLQKLKQDSQLREIPVVMVSASDDIDNVIRCIELGAADYLVKPFNIVLLRARIGALLEAKWLREKEQQSHSELQEAMLKAKQQGELAEALLANILPQKVADQLRANGSVEPMYFEDVTVTIIDFVGFTIATEKLSAEDLVMVLHDHFSDFDEIVSKYGLEKLKTIGDAYMYVGGLPERSSSHPVDSVLAAFEILQAVHKRGALGFHEEWKLRIGVHTGPVIAGVVGKKKFAFDIWGDTVNISSRMESFGLPNRINISATTHVRVKDFFQCEPRGRVKTKGGRLLDMYFAGGLSPSIAARDGEPPFSRFLKRYRTYFGKELQNSPEFVIP